MVSLGLTQCHLDSIGPTRLEGLVAVHMVFTAFTHVLLLFAQLFKWRCLKPMHCHSSSIIQMYKPMHRATNEQLDPYKKKRTTFVKTHAYSSNCCWTHKGLQLSIWVLSAFTHVLLLFAQAFKWDPLKPMQKQCVPYSHVWKPMRTVTNEQLRSSRNIRPLLKPMCIAAAVAQKNQLLSLPCSPGSTLLTAMVKRLACEEELSCAKSWAVGETQN